MAVAPSPDEIYRRAEQEGRRRLDMPPLEQVSTGFIAGVTIVFGITALGVVEGLVEPQVASGPARVLGALAFGIGLVFLVVGRSELFTENFFDPVATAISRGVRASAGRLLRLWSLTLVLNLVGGAVLIAVLSVDGALPDGAHDQLDQLAEETAARAWSATLARAVLAGALLTLLSYLLHAVDGVGGRIAVSYMAGFLVALGPFDHVVVSVLHLLFGLLLDASVSWLDLLENAGLATVGNLLGGLLLITLTHTAQVKGSRDEPR